MNLEERYLEWASDPEERVTSPRELFRHFDCLLEKTESAVKWYIDKGFATSDLIGLVCNPYVYEVLLDRATQVHTQAGPLNLVYEPDTSWAYCGEGYYPGITQIPNMSVLLLSEHIKYCWRHNK
jgi:hypothetical protein